MDRFKWLNLFPLLLLIFSCGKSVPDLEGIDIQQWKDDKDGCKNKRTAMMEAVKNEKNKLLALSEMQIVNLLGKPDRNELFKRNQKFFLYFLEPSLRCAQDSSVSPLKLVIRFNAMGLAKEVAVE